MCYLNNRTCIRENMILLRLGDSERKGQDMRVVAAFDSFKGSLTSMEAGIAAKQGILRVLPKARVMIRPMADGGEGTVDAMIEGLDAKRVQIEVHGPRMETVAAEYGILQDGITAVMEMAQAAGLTLLKEEERNPLYTTTRGVGEMIVDACKRGCRRFYIGIGGSATNDGGIGMLSALGYEFLDAEGAPVCDGSIGLKTLKEIHKDKVLSVLQECEFYIACDVKNPLCGESGCSHVFAPQKGADYGMIVQMDQWLAQYARLVRQAFPNADEEAAGSGAAGGLGFAFQAFLRGKLQSGSSLVMELTGLEQEIAQADLVLTGEGRLDGQTAFGKAPSVVAKTAGKYGVPVLGFAGTVEGSSAELQNSGLCAWFPIIRRPVTLQESMKPEYAAESLADSVEQVMRLWNLNKKRRTVE